jgi:osmotically-inducible protein OsmY
VILLILWLHQPFSLTDLRGGVTAMKKGTMLIGLLFVVMLVATLVSGASTPKQESESTGEYVDDSVITTKVKALLAEDDFLKSFKISVKTQKGTVRLSGSVNSQNAVDKAVEITRSVKGVKSVKNKLIVK